MNLPQIIFTNSTDYDEVLSSVKITFSEIMSSKDGDCSDCGDSNLCETLTYIYAADYQKSQVVLNESKYQKAVKAAYLSLSCIKC